jgi:hypothetical protein
MVINSSAQNEHWYWKAPEFITDIKLVERINRGIAYQLGADASGWDINQVLRPPGSFNYKRSYKATIRASSAWVINISSFSGLPEPPKNETEYGVTDLLDTALIIAKYQWPRDIFDLFRTREIEQGGRSTALMHVGYACCEMGMTDQEIFSIIYSADERWGKFRGRQDRAQRLNDIISIARIKHPFAPTLQKSFLEVLDFEEFMEKEVNIEWVIKGMLEQTGQMILSSKPGIGKTQLTLRFFMAMAMGQRFLHYDIIEPRKVIFYSLEMGHAQLKYFLSQMVESYTKEQRELLKENFLIVPLGEALYLNSSVGQKIMEESLSKFEPDGFAVDSLSRTTNSSSSDEEQIKSVLDWDAKIRNQTKTFSWYVHHNRKSTIGNRKPKTLDDLIGATIIQANTSSVYTMWRQKDDSYSPIEIINVKQRLGVMEKPYLITRGPGLSFTESAMVNVEADDSSSKALGLGSTPRADADTLPHLPEPRSLEF